MALCIATHLVSGDLATKVRSIAEAGFHSLELFEPDFTGYGGTAESFKQLLLDQQLTLSAMQPFQQLEGFKGVERERAVSRLSYKLDLMQSLGVSTLLLSSNTHPASSVDRCEVVEDLVAMAEIASSRDIRFAYMASASGRCVNDDVAAMAVVEAVDSPAFGLGLNSVNSLRSAAKPAALRGLLGQKIFHVQLFDQSARPLGSESLPGLGDLRLAEYVRVISKCGYSGCWSLAPVDPSAVRMHEVSDAYRALAHLLDSVARTDPALDFSVPPMPARVAAMGFEFIEFAADKEKAEELQQLLSSLCFRRERKHVSKNVELWRQGAVNILLNTEQVGFSFDAFQENGPSVCDMGIRVQDAAQAVQRATVLGTPPFTQAVTTGELQIPAIKGVGGNVVHFVDEKSDLHRMWDIDFEAVRKTEAVQPAGIRSIDHVAQTMSEAEMQSSLLYYLSTFEMEKSSQVPLADPAGLVRSQSIQSTENELRLGLNGAESRRTFAGAFLAERHSAGVQHIALRSDDIFESSTLLQAAGFPRLQISDNYYNDLQAVFSLDAEFVRRLAEANILYDRVGSSEFFQIYSAPIFEGFFFEVVQRVGGYAGYGARNAPFRLAAQQKTISGKQVSTSTSQVE